MLGGTLLLQTSCSDSLAGSDLVAADVKADSRRSATEESKKYWYNGTAEITSFKLSQARYGEMREGTAVMVFVTEPFSPESNTKADRSRSGNVPVLKLNATKKFNTGIYPYSLMTSTFVPFEGKNTSLKISFTMQEWCGTLFSEMRNQKGKISYRLDSYFEGESFENTTVEPDYIEDDIWSLIRLNPETIPNGMVKMVPSMAFVRMLHVPVKAYETKLEKVKNDDGSRSLIITTSDLNRVLNIRYEGEFPHRILGWEETYIDGGKKLTSKGERIQTIRSAYWGKNSNSDAYLRKELGLD